MQRSSTFQAPSALVTFDRAGRIEAVCVGIEHPKLVLLDPKTLDCLARSTAARIPNAGGGNPFTDFSEAGYFYLDQGRPSRVSTTTQDIWSSARRPAAWARFRARARLMT